MILSRTGRGCGRHSEAKSNTASIPACSGGTPSHYEDKQSLQNNFPENRIYFMKVEEEGYKDGKNGIKKNVINDESFPNSTPNPEIKKK